MAGREVVKNIKPVFCRFDMDNEQERRAWQIIQKLSKGQEEGRSRNIMTSLQRRWWNIMTGRGRCPCGTRNCWKG